MRLTIGAIGLLMACTPSPRVPGSVAGCNEMPLYRGVVDPNAARVPLEFRYVNAMSDSFRPVDICLLIDDQSMLSKADFERVVPRLELREPIIWRADLSPGKHSVRVFLLFHDGANDRYRYQVKSTHPLDVQTASWLEVVAIEGKGPMDERPRIEWHDANRDRDAGVGAPAR